jgi:hypothetical protein
MPFGRDDPSPVVSAGVVEIVEPLVVPDDDIVAIDLGDELDGGVAVPAEAQALHDSAACSPRSGARCGASARGPWRPRRRRAPRAACLARTPPRGSARAPRAASRTPPARTAPCLWWRPLQDVTRRVRCLKYNSAQAHLHQAIGIST